MTQKRQTWNLSIRGSLKELTQRWCLENDLKDSELVSSLLERHFENLGIPTTLSSREFFERMRQTGEQAKASAEDKKESGVAKIKKALGKE